MIPYNRKLERNKFEIILVFLKWFLLGFIATVALFALFKFFWTLFDACMEKYGVDMPKSMAYRAKNLAIDVVLGEHKCNIPKF